jgi:hypothetical protein
LFDAAIARKTGRRCGCDMTVGAGQFLVCFEIGCFDCQQIGFFDLFV